MNKEEKARFRAQLEAQVMAGFAANPTFMGATSGKFSLQKAEENTKAIVDNILKRMEESPS